MTAMLLCPSDETGLSCPEVVVDCGAPFVVPPDPPDPGPGDPGDVLVSPAPTPMGHRVQVLICHPVSHQPLAEIRTARAVEWVDRFGKGEATFTASTWDPAWSVAPIDTETVRGVKVVKPDLKGLEVTIGLNGARMWSGILQQPHSWSKRTVTVKADSIEAQFEERTLGETEQRDYYAGRGSFPSEDLTGWEFDTPIVHSWITSGQYEGARSLRLRAVDAGAWSYGPWKLMPGEAGFPRYPVGSMLVRAPYGTTVTAGVQVRTVTGAPVNDTFSKANWADSDPANVRWQGPVAGRAQLPGVAANYWVRVGIYIPRNVNVDVDLVRLQWPTLTGYPNEQDLSKYPGRILRDAQYGPGGVDAGIPTTVRSLTGKVDKITWPHQDDHPVSECLSTVTSMDGGPDFWITAGCRGITAKRRGQDRADVALTEQHIIECTPTVDPGGQVDELRGTTDIGTGAYRHVFAYNARRRPNRRRIRKLVPVPSGLQYDAGRAWTKGQGEFSSREPFSAVVSVDLGYGMRFAVGDGCRFSYADGWAWWGPVRIGSRRVQPSLNRVVFEVGEDPVVAL